MSLTSAVAALSSASASAATAAAVFAGYPSSPSPSSPTTTPTAGAEKALAHALLARCMLLLHRVCVALPCRQRLQ